MPSTFSLLDFIQKKVCLKWKGYKCKCLYFACGLCSWATFIYAWCPYSLCIGWYLCVYVCVWAVNKIEQLQGAHAYMHADKHTDPHRVRPAGIGCEHHAKEVLCINLLKCLAKVCGCVCNRCASSNKSAQDRPERLYSFIWCGRWASGGPWRTHTHTHKHSKKWSLG